MAAPNRQSVATWSGFTALYVGLTLAYAWPLLASIATGLPHDIGDPGLNAWIIWWNSQAVPFTEYWWNAPIFYPITGAFALSETLLSLSLVTTPLLVAGASAVVTYNVAFLISFPATALAAHGLAHRLTRRHDAALIAGLAFGFNPYRASQMPHIQMQWAMWMPLVLLALHRYLDTHRRRDLILAGVCWVLNGLTSGYFLVYFGVLAALWMLWFVRTWRDWFAVGGTLIVASLVLAPTLIGYAHHQAALGLTRYPEEISAFSADLSGVLSAATTLWLPSRWTIEPLPEGELYPGATIVLLTMVGGVVAWRRARTHRWSVWQIVAALAGLGLGVAATTAPVSGWHFSVIGIEVSLTRIAKAIFTSVCLVALAFALDRRILGAWRRRSPLMFYAAAAAIMMLFALGPVGHAFGHVFLSEAPYAFLMTLPGGHALRVPARFAMLLVLCLAQAGALALSHLTPRGARRLVVAAIAVAVLLDGWVLHLPVAEVSLATTLAGTLDRQLPILEIPVENVFTDAASMLRATEHKHPLVNGFSGYAPVHYDQLRAGVNERDPSIIDALQRIGPLIVAVDRARDPDEEWTRFMREIPDAQWLFRSPLGAVFRLPGLPPVARDVTARRLPIAYVDASANFEALRRMLDGDIVTRWATDGPQVPNNWVAVVLTEPAVVTRLEMDLGEWSFDYPRRLRVVVADEGRPAVTVWEGETAGSAMLGSLSDRVHRPVTIDLPPGTLGRRFVLTTLTDNPIFYWGIAELRVYGKGP